MDVNKEVPKSLNARISQIGNGYHNICSPSNTLASNYECPKCKKNFEVKCDYKLHFEVTHLGLSPFKCFCKKIFARKSEFEEHKKEHQRFLDLEVKSEPELSKADDVQGQRPYVKVKKSTLQKVLADDIKTTAVKNKKYGRGVNTEIDNISEVCQVCNKKFANKYTCQLHYKTVHLKLKRFQCDFCKMRFSYKSSLFRHELRFKNRCQRKCFQMKQSTPKNEISKVTSQRKVQGKNLKLHPSSLQMKCKKDDTAKRQKAAEKKYIQKEQNTIKKQIKNDASTEQLIHEKLGCNDYGLPSSTQCSRCKKIFVSEASCKRHYQCVHLKFRRYRCHVCGRGLSDTRTIYKHIASKHPDVKLNVMAKKTIMASPPLRSQRRCKKEITYAKQPNNDDSESTTKAQVMGEHGVKSTTVIRSDGHYLENSEQSESGTISRLGEILTTSYSDGTLFVENQG